MFIRLEYKGKKTKWYNAELDEEIRALRCDLYTTTAFSCYDAIASEFCEHDEKSKTALKRFLSWMDDDTYDNVCDLFFEFVIIERLTDDGEYLGIIIEQKEENEIEDELEEQAEEWY